MSAIEMLKDLSKRLFSNAKQPKKSAEYSFSKSVPFTLIEDGDAEPWQHKVIGKNARSRVAGEHRVQFDQWYDSIDHNEFELPEAVAWYDMIAREEFFGLNGIDAIPTREFTISDITRQFDALPTREFTLSNVTHQFDNLGTREFTLSGPTIQFSIPVACC